MKFTFENYVKELSSKFENSEKLFKFKIIEKIVKNVMKFNEDQVSYVYQFTRMVKSSKESLANDKNGNAKLKEERPIEISLDESATKKEESEKIKNSEERKLKAEKGKKCFN